MPFTIVTVTQGHPCHFVNGVNNGHFLYNDQICEGWINGILYISKLYILEYAMGIIIIPTCI